MAKGSLKARIQLTVQQTLIPLNLHTQFSLECSCQYGWALELEVVNYTNNPLIACRAQMKWTRQCGSNLQCGKWNGRASPIIYVHVLSEQTVVDNGDWVPQYQSIHAFYLFFQQIWKLYYWVCGDKNQFSIAAWYWLARHKRWEILQWPIFTREIMCRSDWYQKFQKKCISTWVRMSPEWSPWIRIVSSFCFSLFNYLPQSSSLFIFLNVNLFFKSASQIWFLMWIKRIWSIILNMNHDFQIVLKFVFTCC